MALRLQVSDPHSVEGVEMRMSLCDEEFTFQNVPRHYARMSVPGPTFPLSAIGCRVWAASLVVMADFLEREQARRDSGK